MIKMEIYEAALSLSKQLERYWTDRPILGTGKRGKSPRTLCGKERTCFEIHARPNAIEIVVLRAIATSLLISQVPSEYAGFKVELKNV